MESAYGDILRHGFLPGYTEWTVHGEHTISLPPSQYTNVNVEETFFGQEDIRGLYRNALGINSLPLDNTQLGDITIEGDTEETTKNGDHGEEGVSYKRLLEECDKELYTGCKYSSLSSILHLCHIRCIGGISNKTFSMMLELLRDAFLNLAALPSSAYEANKFTKDLGLVSKMFKSKTTITMQKHKRKQSEMNPPTSHNIQTQSKSFSTNMQTTRQAINNTNHPSSALKATLSSFQPAIRTSFPYTIPQNSSPASFARQAIYDTNHLSSSFQPAIRPSFLYDIRQSSSSSSSSLQAYVRPNVRHNSSSSSSSHS
nr:tetratricopeptide-like helical domain, DYW domain protein [Tanacetum cinerariifolium]